MTLWGDSWHWRKVSLVWLALSPLLLLGLGVARYCERRQARKGDSVSR